MAGAEKDTSELKRDVIRKILEREIISHCKAAEREARNKNFTAAAKIDAMREGLSWALFVLANECSV